MIPPTLSDISIGDLERFTDRYALGVDRGADSRHFLRVKIPNGALTTKQLRGIVDLAERFSRGYAEITDRQDIQLHWIDAEDALELFSYLERLGFTTDKCGQSYPGARYGDVRNILGCPVAGVEKDELINVQPIVRELTAFFSGNREYLDLPRKFKVSITGCSAGCTVPEVNDLSFIGVRNGEGEVGFTALVGGGIGVAPMLARPLGVFVRASDVFDVVKTMVEIYRDFGQRKSKPRARFKWLVHEWGIERLRSTLEGGLGKKLESFPIDQPIASGGEHMGIQPQKQRGYCYVSVPILGGILKTSQMMDMADIAERYGAGELRLTSSQNLIIIDISESEVQQVLQRLKEIGLPLDGVPLDWTTVACAGNFCGKTSEDPKQRAITILGYLKKDFGELLQDLNLRIALSGCPNACGRHNVADIGLQGVTLRIDGSTEPGYNLYLGGRLGSDRMLAKLVERSICADKVVDAIANIISAYMEKKNDSESFSDFCNRHSVEELKCYIKFRNREEDQKGAG